MSDPTGPKLLWLDDEPQEDGAVVAVHFGDDRAQEIWVRDGAMTGCWYPFGSNKGILGVFFSKRPKAHSRWEDVLARGPVTLLVVLPAEIVDRATPPAALAEAYRQGWRAGRRDLWQAMEETAEEDPTGGGA